MRRRIIVFCMTAVIWMLICPYLRGFADDGMEMLEEAADSLALPDDVAEIFDDTGISSADPQTVLSVPLTDWLRKIWETFCGELRAPLMLLTALLTLTMLSAMVSGLHDTAENNEIRHILDILCMLVCIGAAEKPLCTTLSRTADALDEGRVFMASFIPIFSGLLAAGGAAEGGASYQAATLFLTETVQQLNAHILFPLLRAAAALSAANAVNPALHLSGMVRGMRKFVTWLLGFLMAVFAAAMSVRSFAASAAAA